MEIRYKLNKEGSSELWTRKPARKMRLEVEEILPGLAPGDALVLDAKGVRVFDFSFANELFGRLAHDLPTLMPGRFIIVTNLSMYARENLHRALDSLGLVMVERRAGQLSLLGKAGVTDAKTFQAIAKEAKPVTAAALAGSMRTNPTAMNERLTKLTRLGLVSREKGASKVGREQYEYTTPA